MGRRERVARRGRSCFWGTDGSTATGSALTRKMMLAGTAAWVAQESPADSGLWSHPLSLPDKNVPGPC